jgi:hypothetical protein
MIFRENQMICFICNSFYSESRAFFGRGGNVKNMFEPDRPQVTIRYDTCALHAGLLRLQTHTDHF